MLGVATSGPLFGAAAGVSFGPTAGLKAMTSQLSTGFGHVLASWAAYAMVATGLTGMFLVQNAFQAGKLIASQPGISLLDPFWAVVWGVIAFHEQTERWLVRRAGRPLRPGHGSRGRGSL